MNRIITIMILLLSGFQSVVSQNTYEYFNKVYGEVDENNQNISVANPSSVVEIEEGYLAVGYYDDSLSNPSIEIFKCDLLGDLEWHYPIPIEDTILCYYVHKFIIKDLFGNYIVAASYYNYQEPYDNDLLLAKLDSSGNYLSHITYGAEGFNEFCNGLISTPDSGYVSVGYRLDYTDIQSNINGHVIKFNKNFEIEWDREYSWDNNNSQIVAALPTNNEFVFTGGYAADTVKSVIFKTDLNGEIISEIEFEASCYASIFAFSNGGNLISTCYENEETGENELQLLKLNEDFEIYWEKKFELFDEYQIDIFRTPLQINGDGSFVGSVDYLNDYGYIEALLVEFDSLGNINWTNRITTDTLKNCLLGDVKRTRDGGYIWSGYQLNSPQRGWLIKTDCKGNTCSTLGCDSIYVHTDTMTEPLCQPLPQPFFCNSLAEDFEFEMDSILINDEYILPPQPETIDDNYLTYYLMQSGQDEISLLEGGSIVFSSTDSITFRRINILSSEVNLLETAISSSLSFIDLEMKLNDLNICYTLSTNSLLLIIKEPDLSIESAYLNHYCQVYPNPASTQLNFRYSSNNEIQILSFFTVYGQLVAEKKIAAGTNAITLKVSNFPPGLYCWSMGEFSGRVVVE